MSNTKTIDQVKSEFARRGESVAAWAQGKGLRVNAVYDLLNGRTMGNRGHAHNAAVLLGLKEGAVNNQYQGGQQ